jgi:hypothetical protein
MRCVDFAGTGLMLRRILVLAVIALTSCQSLALSPASYENTVRAESTADTNWITTETNGVRLEMRMPTGWAADIEDGLLLAEQTTSPDTGEVQVTVLIHLFVPTLDDFDLPEEVGENTALVVLDQAVTMPSVVGQNVVVSEPVGFMWNGRDAAYYLLTNYDGVKTIVIAVEANRNNRLVVCNISMPASEASRVRDMLPELLDGMQINDMAMDGMALDALPDPLMFPHYDSSPEMTPTVVQ